MSEQINALADLIRAAGTVTFFGGAGVSTESGIPDFRSAQGLFSVHGRIPPETILSHSFFMKHPAEFYRFYRENLLYPRALPNDAHKALFRLEELGKLRCVVTQNIDGLHQKAGSRIVCELHGSTKRNHCMACGKRYESLAFDPADSIPRCECGGIVRPDVVLYEEGLDQGVMNSAIRHIQASDLLLVGGTSLNVYPAAGFVRLCRGKIVIVNLAPTPYDDEADLVIRGSIGHTLKEAVRILEAV